ncbi:hypothetical protein ACFPOE_21495 [Caenimonas terrae]|uniref:Uncharacterized protein n=1 Tax=Caenimonas terrae TaxID=696074 RepID=A0ABW0NLW7_9BURK
MRTHLSAAAWRGIAVALLALALAAIGAMHYASQRMIAIQGPGAMQAMGDQALWLSVNEELWVLDAAGSRIARKTAADLGLAAAVSNIVPAPDGQALLTSREDTSWQVVKRADLSRVRTIRPKWPPQFEGHASGAIHVAVSPQWDIAVATGGGHAVLLFDGEGNFKGRTAPGLYRFTNGLWHSPEGWWTTDTNSFKLRLLDTRTLALKQTIDLRDTTLPYAFLGELAASGGAPQALTQQPPVATVSRVGALMEPGHVVDIFPDGSQAVYNREPIAVVRDIAWFNGDLLVIDGAKYQLARYSARREELPRFGDPAVNAELDAMLERRQYWSQLSSRYVFLPAATLLLLGMAAYGRSKTVARQQVIAQRPPYLVGTPAITRGQAAWQWAWVVALPYLLRLAFVFAVLSWWPRFALPRLAAAGLVHGFWGALLSKWLLLWLPLVAWMALERRRHDMLSANPAREAILNRRAVAWLGRYDDFDAIALPNEQPRETVLLLGWRPRWLLVTNQRLLLFAASPRERRLVSQWPRNSVAEVARQAPPADRWLTRWRRRWLHRRVNLYVRFKDGSVLQGFAASQVAARRVLQLLEALTAAGRARAVAPAARQSGRRWHEVIASAALPGLGQLLQDRFASGAVLLTAAGLLLMGVVGPVLWAASGPKMDVSPAARLAGALWWLLLAGTAALDAWYFSAARRRRAAA